MEEYITIDINLSIKRTSKLCLLVLQKQKAWNKTGEKSMPEERRQNLAETNRGLFYNQEEWVEEFLDYKGAFYNGSESDDSDNDDENYNKNMETVVCRCSSK